MKRLELPSEICEVNMALHRKHRKALERKKEKKETGSRKVIAV